MSLVVPDRAPNLAGHNASSTSVRLSWSTIQPNHSNGQIRNYNLSYYKTNGKHKWKIVQGNSHTSEVTQLERFMIYNFRIAGINRRGCGVDSDVLTIRTDEDSK